MSPSLFINIGTQEMIILLFIVVPTLLLPIYCLIDLFKRDFSGQKSQQYFLILLLVLAPFIGSILYLTVLKKDYPLKRNIERY